MNVMGIQLSGHSIVMLQSILSEYIISYFCAYATGYTASPLDVEIS